MKLKFNPETDDISKSLVEQLFSHLPENDKNNIHRLFFHAIDHPWTDDDLKTSIVQNICNDFGFEIPEEYKLL